MLDMRSDFLKTIVAYPDDITPRLVFADWLEEQGLYNTDEYCEQARFLRQPDGELAQTLRRRKNRIRAKILRESIPSLPKGCRFVDAWHLPGDPALNIVEHMEPIRAFFPGLQRVFVTVRHGLIEQIGIHPKTFIQIAADLFASHPVREVFLTYMNPAWPIPPDVHRVHAPLPIGWMRFDDSTVGSMPGTAVIGPIWNALEPRREVSVAYRRYAPYATRLDAYLALSAACVQWGQELAGVAANHR